MNLYHVTLFDRHKNENVFVSIVAKNAEIALNAAVEYRGEIVNFKLQQTGLVVVS